ncbi:MAG TPA: orotidine-5'-phosphate decarboxylase [Gemmatimonadaceae bacterium]|nr:orotidine-5'-phosphate decarboxylase [Gemmatimonadaceae bacterium]
MTASKGAVPIIALDVPSSDKALALVAELSDACRFYKIGNELFTSVGPDIVRRVRDGGADVFLDLKLHDIPNTVAGGVRAAAAMGARLVTVHATGGLAMLRAATEAGGADCGVLAVTVLTSLTAEEIAQSWGRASVDVGDEVLRLAELAAEAGAHGIVCSGREARSVSQRFGADLAVLVPGVRASGGAVQDQARVVTPREAAAAGATYVVVGRMVTAAPDRVTAMAAVRAELGS